MPLFAALGPEATTRRLEQATERRLHAGETLIEQWDTSRDVFVVIEGDLRVLETGRDVGSVGPGDFVGEMAALDWGAGYGPLRAAAVEALTPTRVLVLTPGQLPEALAGSPAARDLLETTARERLAAKRSVS